MHDTSMVKHYPHGTVRRMPLPFRRVMGFFPASENRDPSTRATRSIRMTQVGAATRSIRMTQRVDYALYQVILRQPLSEGWRKYDTFCDFVAFWQLLLLQCSTILEKVSHFKCNSDVASATFSCSTCNCGTFNCTTHCGPVRGKYE